METLIVGGIVVLAAVMVARGVWRFFTRAPSCSCEQGSSGDCGGKCPATQGQRPGDRRKDS